ncbi:MAG TPA: hypothetical protein PKC76_08190 [Saprospiraceae bacterium]|nr:hypothetical protein [Saprospiraceae bacterium]
MKNLMTITSWLVWRLPTGRPSLRTFPLLLYATHLQHRPAMTD